MSAFSDAVTWKNNRSALKISLTTDEGEEEVNKDQSER